MQERSRSGSAQEEHAHAGGGDKEVKMRQVQREIQVKEHPDKWQKTCGGTRSNDPRKTRFEKCGKKVTKSLSTCSFSGRELSATNMEGHLRGFWCGGGANLPQRQVPKGSEDANVEYGDVNWAMQK